MRKSGREGAIAGYDNGNQGCKSEMELSNVLYYNNGEWSRITLPKALEKYPYGASAGHRVFKCGWCNQYVTLACGQDRQYFKHSSQEADKSCEERSFGSGYSHSSQRASQNFNVEDYNLPLRLKIHSKRTFELEVGLLPIPKSAWSNSGNFTILILGYDENGYSVNKKFEYNKERVDPTTTSYLSLGSTPCSRYTLALRSVGQSQGEANVQRFGALQQYWSPRFDGVRKLDRRNDWYGQLLDATYARSLGALFAKGTGKRVPRNGVLQINRPYYLLTNSSRFDGELQDVSRIRVCDGDANWRVHEIVFHNNGERARQIASAFECTLADAPVEFTPIYPIFIEQPYSLRHASGWRHYFIMRGEAQPHVSPRNNAKPFPLNEKRHESLLVLENTEIAQQLLALGNENVLEYSYLWRDQSLFQRAPSAPTSPSVLDGAGKNISPGEHRRLPHKKSIRIVPERNATLRILRQNDIIAKLEMAPDRETRYDELQLGDDVEIYYGLDLVWRASFISERAKQVSAQLDDRALCAQLSKFRGDEIPVTRALGGLGDRLRKYPLVQAWLRRRLALGLISQRARTLLLSSIANSANKE